MGVDDKVRTRSAAEISDIVKNVIGSPEMGEFFGNIVKSAISECIDNAVSEATKELKKEIFELNKVILELKNKAEPSDVNGKRQQKQSDVTPQKTTKYANGVKTVPAKETSARTYKDALSNRDDREEANVEKIQSTSNSQSRDNEDSFQVVMNRRKKRNFATGTKLNTNLTAADKEIYLHVWRLNPKTNEADVIAYIESSKPGMQVQCEKLNARGNYSSFKVTALESTGKELLEPEFWPVGVVVDEFLNRRPRPGSLK